MTLDQLVQDGDATAVDIAASAPVVALDGLTPRQREVAAVAVDHGYFDPEGATAADVASELSISKSTLSEHLRIVQRELVRQSFGG